MKILVTGATGYVGGRLIPKLLDAGHDVRVLVRDRDRISGRAWVDRVEIHVGDLLEPATLEGLCDGIDAAYYLVHSMGAGKHYAARDTEAAANFCAVGRAAGLGHVIYLGGLLPRRAARARHLASRARTGRELARALPTTEFRAGPIIGSGSASFEMVRYLTERLPVMITPRWIRNEVNPIAVRDILAYLVEVLQVGPSGVVDVGGEALSYEQMMLQFAAERGLWRRIYPTPVLAPRLAARWVGFVTPLSNNFAVPLVASIVESATANTRRARRLFPGIRPIPYREAVRFALRKTEGSEVETRWSDALGGGPTYRLTDSEGMAREVRSIHIPLPPEAVAHSFFSIGGDRGWLVWRWAWKLRSWMDKMIGGPGLRRGRRHPHQLVVGEALDFWRVEAADFPQLLRLRAEMLVPGRAWIQWETHPERGGTRLVQSAIFAPRGFIGFAYWYMLYPVHLFIFSDLIRAIGRDAKRQALYRR